MKPQGSHGGVTEDASRLRRRKYNRRRYASDAHTPDRRVNGVLLPSVFAGFSPYPWQGWEMWLCVYVGYVWAQSGGVPGQRPTAADDPLHRHNS